MNTAIALCDDLAKLTDQELADRLKTCWDAYEATGLPPPGRLGINFRLLFTFRGPIYRQSAFGVLGNNEAGFFAALFLGLLHLVRRLLLRKDPATDAHIIMCEISDIMDEIEYRLKQRQRRPWWRRIFRH
jgi:hypothetical protein